MPGSLPPVQPPTWAASARPIRAESDRRGDGPPDRRRRAEGPPMASTSPRRTVRSPGSRCGRRAFFRQPAASPADARGWRLRRAASGTRPRPSRDRLTDVHVPVPVPFRRLAASAPRGRGQWLAGFARRGGNAVRRSGKPGVISSRRREQSSGTGARAGSDGALDPAPCRVTECWSRRNALTAPDDASV